MKVSGGGEPIGEAQGLGGSRSGRRLNFFGMAFWTPGRLTLDGGGRKVSRRKFSDGKDTVRRSRSIVDAKMEVSARVASMPEKTTSSRSTGLPADLEIHADIEKREETAIFSLGGSLG